MNTPSLFIGMIAGALGTGYFIYGKRQAHPTALFCGLGLMLYPFFFTNLWALLFVGVALCLIPFFISA